jgi:hypothetical protein
MFFLKDEAIRFSKRAAFHFVDLICCFVGQTIKQHTTPSLSEKQKIIFYGKLLQKSGKGRLCQWQTLLGK